MNKSKFLTFIFSALPGLGQYYLGQITRGFQMMTIFFGAIFLLSFLSIDGYPFVMPIIWFYVLFDALEQHRIIQERKEVIDPPVIPLDKMKLQKHWIGIGLIFVGIYVLLSKIVYRFFGFQFYDLFKSIIVALIFILIGWFLITGKKVKLNKNIESRNVE